MRIRDEMDECFLVLSGPRYHTRPCSFPGTTRRMENARVTISRGFVAAALSGLLLASCSKSDQEAPAKEAPSGAQPAAGGSTLVINTNTSDPAPKAAFEQLIGKFEAEHPDIEVELNVFDHESYKTSVRNFLSSEAPDVITWFAGNRMKAFVDLGLLEDVSDLWKPAAGAPEGGQGLTRSMSKSLGPMTVDGKQYGVPYTYYQWGIYYRRDLFELHGLAVPETWDELLAVCKALKAKDIAPFTIGTKYLWTAAGWFDYLNLRINGLAFHQDLMQGKVPYTHDRVKAVFDEWRTLIDAGYYVDNHAAYSWQEAQAFLYQGKAAMYLIGNFLVPNLPDDARDNIAYFPFPSITPNVGKFEDAPIDTLHIPARAKNKAAARKFLAFAARPAIQSAMNETLGQLPPHQDATVKDDRFLQAGAKVLGAAEGLAQFYDRDTDPEMAKIGMKGFQEFMVKPDRRDAILERLDKARQRIFE